MRGNTLTILLIAALSPAVLAAPAPVQPERTRPHDHDDQTVSPARGIHRGKAVPQHGSNGPRSRFPSIDGTGNSRFDPEMGAAFTPLRREMAAAYGDGIASMAGQHRPGPRAISNAVCAQDESIPNALGASDYLWQWGQFLDHDIDLTDGTDPPEPANIPIPTGDAWFDPDNTGAMFMRFNRSIYDHSTGIDAPREQLNEITAWIDASNVYGSDAERQAALRTLDGTGRLKENDGFLPWNLDGLPNAGGSSAGLFLAGDVRANEQVGLTALHTLFVREHNRLATALARRRPGLTGDQIYEHARRLVGAQMQAITYNEFLPALLGPGAPGRYRGYVPEVDGGIRQIFSTASYRFGHSALSPTLLRLDASGAEITHGHLALRDAFFSPSRLTDEGGIEPILRGLAAQRCQAVDVFVIDDVRNFLFGAPGSGGFDLPALNIQRGRDHGLPSYNDARVAMGLRPARSFADISSNPVVRERLESVYLTVEDVDVWVGGLAEDPRPRSHVGRFIGRVLTEQFEALRDGDSFWYQRHMSRHEQAWVERSTLAEIIRRNTDIGDELQDDVFRVPGSRHGKGPRGR